MKKIRFAVCVMMLTLAMLCMTGCGNNNNSGQESSQSSASSQESGSASGGTDQTGGNTDSSSSESGMSGSSGSAGSGESTSGGVIEGLVDDVERGVEDLTGDGGATTAAADESR